MPGSLPFGRRHATPRSVRRERRDAVPDRVAGGPTRAPSGAIEKTGSRDDRIEGGLRALVVGLGRYEVRDRSLRRPRRSLRCRAATLAMAGTRWRVTVTSRHR